MAVAFNGENVRNGGTVKLTNGAGNVVTVTVTQGNAVRVYTVTITATIGRLSRPRVRIGHVA